MPLADAIRRIGFVRWYEHQLYEGFACLVTGFLALIMMAIALEVGGPEQSLGRWLWLGAVAAGGGSLCIFTWRRFTSLLARAEHFAGQANCPACSTYARFGVVSSRLMPESIGRGAKMALR